MLFTSMNNVVYTRPIFTGGGGGGIHQLCFTIPEGGREGFKEEEYLLQVH